MHFSSCLSNVLSLSKLFQTYANIEILVAEIHCQGNLVQIRGTRYKTGTTSKRQEIHVQNQR